MRRQRSTAQPLGWDLSHWGRLRQIVQVFARHGLSSFTDRLGLYFGSSRSSRSDQGSTTERWAGAAPPPLSASGVPASLCRALEELGPAFVKLGQILASRDDLLSPGYAAALQSLHQHVAPLPFSVIHSVLTAELGSALSDFTDISEKPLASGSLGQVHAARLKSGEAVVIKVQRPDIAALIKTDLTLMQHLARLVERFMPEARPLQPTLMVGEFARGLGGELDYIREANNIVRMARNFSAVPHVVLPEVMWHLSSSRVLTMTDLSSLIPLKREVLLEAKLAPELIIDRAFKAFLKMVLIDGVFHGDMHPGNLFALSGNRIALLDLGLVITLAPALRRSLLGLMQAFVAQDFHRVVRYLSEICEPHTQVNNDALEHDITNAVAPFIGSGQQGLRTSVLFWDAIKIATRHGMALPPNLILFFKSLSTFEGIGAAVSPGFDILSAAQSFAAELTTDLYQPQNIKGQAFMLANDLLRLMEHGPFELRRLVKAVSGGDLSLRVKSEEVSRLARAVDRASGRVALGVVAGSLTISAALGSGAPGTLGLVQMPAISLLQLALAFLMIVLMLGSMMRR